MRRHLVGRPALLAGILSVFTASIPGVFLARGSAASDEKIGARPTAADPARAEDEKGIRAAAAAFTKAFNAGDAKAVASLFTPDADYVDDDGQEFQGREAIEKEYALAFARKKGMTGELTIDSIRFLGKDVAIQNGVARVRTTPGERGQATRFTAVFVRQKDRWLMESVRESPYQPASNYEYLSDLEWLVGSWSAKTGSVVIEMKCDWTANRNFLLHTFTVKGGGNTLSSGTQVIGWDPILGQVRSWSFDSDGGFGAEVWVRDGKGWVLEATGVRREGSRTAAKNRVTPEDAHTFTWQSTNRLAEGVKLPDTGEIKFLRTSIKK